MKKIQQILQSFSFEEANQVLTFQDIYNMKSGDIESKFSITLKKLVVLLIGLSLPTLMLIRYLGVSGNLPTSNLSRGIAIVFSILVICELLYFYFNDRCEYSKNYRYHAFIYIVGKNIFILMIGGAIGTDDGNYLWHIIQILIYIFSALYLYSRVEKNLVLETINNLFTKKYKISKLLSITFRISGIVMIVGVVIVQFYRLNKFWIRTVDFSENTDFSFLTGDFSWILAIPFLLLIALIPTYLCFDASSYVKKALLDQYPEEFRKVYNFTKEEWYGE